MIRRAAAAAVALLVLLAAGCFAQGGDPGRASTPSRVVPPSAAAPSAGTSSASPAKPRPPTPAGVNVKDADAVAEAVAAAAVTWDTAVDLSQYDGLRRMTPLMTKDLAGSYAVPTAGVPTSSGPAWAVARNAAAYSVPTLVTAESDHDMPASTPTTQYRLYRAEWDWFAPAGSSVADDRTWRIYITLTAQPDGRWLVSTFDGEEL